MCGVASMSVLPLSHTNAVGRSTTATTTSAAYVTTMHPIMVSSSLLQVCSKPLSKPNHTITETVPTSKAMATVVLNIRPIPVTAKYPQSSHTSMASTTTAHSN